MSDPILDVIVTTLHVHRPVTHDAWTGAEIERCAEDIVAQIVDCVRSTHEGRAWLRDLNQECFGGRPTHAL